MFTVAATDNRLYASALDAGVVGVSASFGVQSGPLHRVVVTRESTLGEFVVGDALPLALEGLDSFGNRVSGSTTLTLNNVAGGLIADDVVLTSGVGSAVALLTRALRGDSIWAAQGPAALGGTSAFDVRPGPGVALVARADTHWGFVGETLSIELAVVDGYGNAVAHDGGAVVISSDDGSTPDQVTAWTPGEVLEYSLETTRFNDTLGLELDGMNAILAPIDVGASCPDFTATAELGASLERLHRGQQSPEEEMEMEKREMEMEMEMGDRERVRQ